MKHLKLFFALFAMLALGVTNAWGAALGSGYEKVTNISSLTTGDRVVLYADDISKGVTGWNGSKDATVAASGWVEYLVEVASGGVYLKDETANNYIASPGSSNQFKYGTKAVCSVDANGVLKCNDRLLCQNGSYYRMYGSVGSYKPFYVYKVVADAGGDETEDLGDALKWSAATATVQMGADDNEFPTLTNDKSATVTYSSSSTEVATIDENGVVTLVKEGTTTISAFFEGGEIEGVTYSAKNVSYTLTVKPAPLVIEPIEGGIIDILTHKTLAATSSSYANFTGKQAANENHSDAVYAGRSARNGNSTQYSIQLNVIGTGRIATTTSGGLAKRVYVKWSTQPTINTNARTLDIYGSNTAFTGNETTIPSTKIGTIKYTTGAAEAYVDLTGDYKYILMTGSAAIYMDEIHVTWVSAAGTVVTPTISGEAEFVESTEVSISTEPGYKVYYTLDDTDPTNASTEYTAPFTVNTTTTVKAVAYDGTSASDVVSATFKKLQSLTCAEAATACSTTESADKYVIRGYVTKIDYAYSSSYNNITFWMADTKDGGNVLQAYMVSPIEDADKAVIVGDQVQVIGKIKLYNTTPEVNKGTYTITVPNPKYNVNIISAHGTVTATPASAVEGAEVTLSVEVESGWVFQNWTVTDASSNNIEVTDNKFTMPASDVTVVANYTESEASDAVLKLSANGTIISEVTYKVGETVELPATIANNCVKIFVGWSANANCATAPEYAPGADFELTATEHTLYAVYASGTTGETVTIKHNLPSNSAAKNLTGENDAATYFDLDASEWSIIGDKGGASNNVGLNKDGTIRLYYAAAGGNTLTITAPTKVATIKLTYNGTLTNAWVKVNGNKVTPTDGVYTIDAETFVIGNANTENAQVHIKNIAVTLAGELADFSTTCTGALAAPTFSVAEGEYTEAKSITLSADEGTIYYTLDGTTPSSASTQYTEAIVLDECGTTTIKAIAISSESESQVASATYTISLPIPANDADNPYTGTEAIEVYNSGCYDDETLVYVTGTVQTAEYSSQYGNYEITFADGFQCFRLQKTATEKFTEDEIGAGDVIVACGKLDKYYENYQLAAGCYLVKHTPSVKADAELAWNPETVTLTVGDAFTAPTLQYPNDITGTITYESSNEDVATVSAEGVIALVDDAVGTATITASFLGDATYKPATATCTIQVKPVQEDCEGSDDFETLEVNSSYAATRTTTAGWKATNAAVKELEGYKYVIINGKTSTVGTITSPELNGGIGSIKIRYANTFSEANGVSFQLDIKQNGAVVKTYTITKTKDEVSQNTVYTELIENINVAGDFQMVFTNLSPSNYDSGNKDRVSIGRLCWTGYEEAPQEPKEETIELYDFAWEISDGSLIMSADWNETPVYVEIYNAGETLESGTYNAFLNLGGWADAFIDAAEASVELFVWANGAAAEMTGTFVGETTGTKYNLSLTGTMPSGSGEAQEYTVEAADLTAIITDGSLSMQDNDGLQVLVSGFDATSETGVYEFEMVTNDFFASGEINVNVAGSVVTLFGDVTGWDWNDNEVLVHVNISGTILDPTAALPVEVTNLQVTTDTDAKIAMLQGTGVHQILGQLSFALMLSNYTGEDGEYQLSDESIVSYLRGWMPVETVPTGSLTKSYSDELGTDVYSGNISFTTADGEYNILLTMYYVAPTAIDVTADNATITWSGNDLKVTAQWGTYPIALTLYSYEAGAEIYSLDIEIGDFDSDDNWYGMLYLDFNYPLTVTESDNVLTIAGYFRHLMTDELHKVTISGTFPTEEEPTPDYTREGLTAGNYGTICLPFGSTNYTGMELYEFVGCETGKAYIASVTTLEAGVPYIFLATATELAVYSDGTTATDAGSHNGLHGTFTDNTVVAVGNYILKNNAICEVTATCWVNKNRAYIVWGDIPAGKPQQMPGRKYISMDVQGENETTGVEDLFTTDAPAKAIVNGQLIIIRDGVKYNVQGQKL